MYLSWLVWFGNSALDEHNKFGEQRRTVCQEAFGEHAGAI